MPRKQAPLHLETVTNHASIYKGKHTGTPIKPQNESQTGQLAKSSLDKNLEVTL